MSATANPLLTKTQFPDFANIKPEHFAPAVMQELDNYKAVVDKVISSDSVNWDETIAPMEQASDSFSTVWNIINHFNSVQNTEYVRTEYEKLLPVVTDFFTDLMQNEKLYNKYLAIKNSPEFDKLELAQKIVIDNELRDFDLAGVSLPEDKRKQYKQISQQLSELGNNYSKNVVDATMGYSKFIPAADKDLLKGLPEHTVLTAKSKAKDKGQDGYLLTLDFPCYFAVASYAQNRQLREELYQAYVTKASDQGPNAGKWDNTENITKILELRQQKAKLLGYKNYSEYSLVPKMAPSTDKVMEFLEDLAKKSKAQAQAEYQELADFAKKLDNIEKLEAWDAAYYAEKYQIENFNISTEELRPYFQEDKVLAGMFKLVERLYGLQIKPETNFSVWHDTVKLFSVYDKYDRLRGRFYTDLYARDSKRGGAWMADLFSRLKQADGAIQTPVAFLEANFTPAAPGKPALLTHDEIITLFHEFGHTLQHILTEVDYLSVSGINGVPWDAVELPSQFMENWCWEWDVVNDLAEHYETGEKLPREVFDRLLKTKNYNSAMQMMRQLEFALFDYRLHLNMQSDQGKSVQQILDEVRSEVAVSIPPSYNRFQHGFTHIFDGGYASGYYSYKWAEVLSSDAFEMFVENGVFNPDIGHKFLTTILEQGGAQDQMELFIEFRGREPSIEPLLKHSGIA